MFPDNEQTSLVKINRTSASGMLEKHHLTLQPQIDISNKSSIMKKKNDLYETSDFSFGVLPQVDSQQFSLVVYLPISLQNPFYSTITFDDVIKKVVDILKTGIIFLDDDSRNVQKFE